MRFEAPTAETLRRQHPEWMPWVTLLEATVDEMSDSAWQSIELQRPAFLAADSPLLADATLAVDPGLAKRWLRRLFRLSAERCEALGGLGHASLPDPLAILQAAIRHECGHLEALAAPLGVDALGFVAVAMLAPLPLLHAVREGAAERDGWTGTFCPVCGDWPMLAENRGVERERRYRCGRCGSDWRAQWLLCPYCGMRDHRRLGHLVSDTEGEMRRIDTCEQCRGYVKVLTTLTPTPAAHVLFQDLATVDLDVTALTEDYRRPEHSGHAVRVTVTAQSRSWRRWTW